MAPRGWRRAREWRSIAVKGDCAASADPGGSIGISGGRVEVATCGRTSAEVF